MPSREEIAGWLKEAALTERVIVLACLNGALPIRFKQEALDAAALFGERAAQVETMRCENCSRAQQAAVLHCEWFGKSVTKSFYCAAFEAKE